MNYILRDWLVKLVVMREIFHLLPVLKWSSSPHIYRGEPPSPRPGNGHETSWTNFIIQWGAATSKPEGGGAHGLVGRPPSWAHRPSLSSIVLFFGPTCQCVVSWLLSRWFSSLVGLPIHVMPAWWYLIGRCFLLGQKGYDCPPFSAKICTHRNLEGHVKFGDLLVAWV